jgi:hypothetical protein
MDQTLGSGHVHMGHLSVPLGLTLVGAVEAETLEVADEALALDLPSAEESSAWGEKGDEILRCTLRISRILPSSSSSSDSSLVTVGLTLRRCRRGDERRSGIMRMPR